MAQPVLDSAAVVIPAHGDGAALQRALGSIAAVDWPAAKLTVCVGIDGPQPRLEQIAQRSGVEVVVLDRNRGSYAARNAAIERVIDRADFVAFTDSDCIAAPGWLKGHATTLAECDLSGGAIDVTLRPRPSPAEFVDRHRHLRQEAYVGVEGYAATANLAVRRDVLDTLRFNADLRSGGDVEFCQRATAAGFRLCYAPDAVVEHPARRTSWQVMKKIRRICTGIEGNPHRWENRTTPVVMRSLYVPRLAYQQGLSRSPWWLGRAWLLEYRASHRIRSTVIKVKRRHGWEV